MSHEYGSSLIPFALFLFLLFLVLPVSADNVTPQTTTAPAQTTTVLPQTTTAPAQTTTVPPETTTIPPVTTTVPPQTTTAPPVTTTATPRQNTTPTRTMIVVSRTLTTMPSPTISVTETPTTGSVMIYSSPTGASILIDGVYCGTTPRNVDGVPAGNHIMRLSLSGYYDYEGSIYVASGQTTQGYGTLQPMNQVISPVPTPVATVIVPVIVPVVTANESGADTGLLGNPSVLVAIIGVITALIAAGASVFTHVKPPKKE